MPTLGAALDFAKLEGRNLRAHQLSAAPSSPVTGQLYYDTVANVLYWYNGTSWISAAGGTAPDATTSSKGLVQLAGDLAGTAASPQIAAGVIVDGDVNSGAAIAESKLNLATDAAVGIGSRRTLGLGAQQAMPGNERLDQITAPTALVNLNNQRIENLADPVNPQGGATKNYVDNTAQGLDAKQSCVCASVAPLTLSGAQTIDGVAVGAGDRVLVKDQASPAANGIYVCAASGWSRATDMDVWNEVPSAFTWVERGTVNADTGWICVADQGGSIGSTAINWTQFSGAAMITAGAGLTKTGNTIDVGAGTGILVAADQVLIDTSILPRYYSSATHGAGTTISITQATHGCRANRGLIVQARDETTGAWELPDIVVASNGDVTVTYAVSVAANSKRIIIVG
jgi:hypothetical protein